MADVRDPLYEDAKRIVPADPDVAGAWACVTSALQAGWLDVQELRAMLAAIAAEIDYANDELHLEFLGPRFRVSFLRDAYECAPAALASVIHCLLARSGVHPGTITIMEADTVIAVRNAEDVPEHARFADTVLGPMPIVKVVMQRMSEDMREILELGPNDQLLRTTVQRRG
jgi:hypothetical protein